MYPAELEIKDTTESRTSASYLNLLLSIGRDCQLHTSIYDKRDDFNFHTTNFPFLSSNIPSSPAYGVFISQLIRYARACSSYECFILRARRLSSKLLKQGYLRLKSSFRKFYGRYGDLIQQYEVSLSRMLNDILTLDQQWLPNQSDFPQFSWPWYRLWPSPIYEWLPWSICNECGMPAGNAYPSGHLVPSPILGLANAPIVENRFLELAMSLLDFSPRIPLGTFSILLDRGNDTENFETEFWCYIFILYFNFVENESDFREAFLVVAQKKRSFEEHMTNSKIALRYKSPFTTFRDIVDVRVFPDGSIDQDSVKEVLPRILEYIQYKLQKHSAAPSALRIIVDTLSKNVRRILRFAFRKSLLCIPFSFLLFLFGYHFVYALVAYIRIIDNMSKLYVVVC